MSVRHDPGSVARSPRALKLVPDAPQRPEPRPRAAVALIALNLIQGIGGIGGAVGMLLHRRGTAGMPLSWLGRFPVHDYLVPGLVLGTALGIAPLVVAFGLWERPDWRWTRPLVGRTHEHWSWVGAAAVAFGLITWIGLEIALMPAKSFLQVAFGFVGLMMAVLVALPSVRRFYAER